MAETQPGQPARGGTNPPPQDAQRAQPASAQPARRVDADRVPNLDVTADPRWALGFLAKLYTTAKQRKALNTLPGWIEPDSRSLSTVFNPARNARVTDRRVRDSVLQVLVKELVDSRQLPANTPQGVDDLRKLFERETILGTSLIERTAVNWMTRTLAASRAKVLQILVEANARPNAVAAAARRVREKVATTYAPIRGDDVYSVLKPKHLRYWRDGTIEDRLLHLRYIAATRRCAEEVRDKQEQIKETDVDLGQELRGLVRFPPERVPSRERQRREERSIREIVDALKVIDTLTWHPKAVKMINAWANGPESGVQSLASIVNGSVTAIDALSAKLAGDSAIVWNFPVALRGGIAGLNVIEQDPLTQYALVWAGAVKPALDTALQVLGDLITVLELFGGPLAPVAAIADAIVQAVSTAVSILKELDQDHAETATEFEKESDRLSTGGKFGDPVLQGVGALLAAKAVPGELRKLTAGKAVKGTAATARSSATPRTNADPAALGSKKTRQDAGDYVTDPAKGTFGKRLAERPKSGALPTSQPASKAITSSPTSRGTETLWAADRKTPKRGKLDQGDLDEARLADDAAQAEEKQGMRIDPKQPASKAPPRAPLPPRIGDRIPNRGKWETKGKLNVNEGAFKFEGKSTKTRLLEPDEFERGFNQQLAQPFAEQISNKPVRRDVEWTTGYTTPSSGKTNRLKFQKTRRGAVLRRRPEATMEVVENIPGQGPSVSEAHFFEATMQPDFKAADAFQGHKQRQIGGTVWLSTEIPRKGYTPNTKLYYHIFCPEPPSQTTIDFLNGVMDQVPNLEINWFVVQ